MLVFVLAGWCRCQWMGRDDDDDGGMVWCGGDVRDGNDGDNGIKVHGTTYKTLLSSNAIRWCTVRFFTLIVLFPNDGKRDKNPKVNARNDDDDDFNYLQLLSSWKMCAKLFISVKLCMSVCVCRVRSH